MPTSFPNPNAPDGQPSKNVPKTDLNERHDDDSQSDDDGRDLGELRTFFGVFCPKWAIPIMATLARVELHHAARLDEPPPALRHRDLLQQIPEMSEKMLTTTLRRLEDAGLVNKEIFPVVPSHVEYSLTETGCKFLKPLGDLEQWCAQHKDALECATPDDEAVGSDERA